MSNLKDALHIPDTQSELDERHLAIQRVGVKNLRYPLQLRIGNAVSPTVALWSLDVALPAEQKGTHMSRFIGWERRVDAWAHAEVLATHLGLDMTGYWTPTVRSYFGRVTKARIAQAVGEAVSEDA